MDPEKRIIAINGPAEALTGLDEAAATGQPCASVLNSEVCGSDPCPFERSFTGGESVTNFNVLMRDASGVETPICTNTSPLKNGKGEVVGVVETIRLVSHINRLIEERLGQRDKVQAVLDSIAGGVVTVDRDGCITSMNRTAEGILGLGAGEAVGRSTLEVLPAELCGPGSPLHETLETRRQVRKREVSMTDQTGKPVPLSLCAGQTAPPRSAPVALSRLWPSRATPT